MERVSLIFHGTENSREDVKLEAFCNQNDEISIKITDSFFEPKRISFITLDRSTAIRFVKHLKKEISLIQPLNENTNG